MIRPGPDWELLAGGEGGSTAGVWRVRSGGRRWIAKRVVPTAGSDDRRSFRWWRREVEFAGSGLPRRLIGLRAPAYRIEEDAEGATLWSAEIIHRPPPDPVIAAALGRLATTAVEDPGWFVINRLRDRVGIAEQLGGIDQLDPDRGDRRALALAGAVWARRAAVLDHLDALPQVFSHGDALPRNLLRQDGSEVIAIDWDQVGRAPIGADLATFALWSSTPADILLDDYLTGVGRGDRAAAGQGLACTAALIAVSRAIRTAEAEQAGGGAGPGPYRRRLDRAVWSMISTLDVVA